MGDLSQIEGIQLTFGNLMGLLFLMGVIAGGVWTVAKIRAGDKEDIEQGYSNAIGRLEKKVDNENDMLHARVNRLVETDSKNQRTMGRLEGFLMRDGYNVDKD